MRQRTLLQKPKKTTTVRAGNWLTVIRTRTRVPRWCVIALALSLSLIHTHSLSLLLVVMMQSKELKNKIYSHPHSLILSLFLKTKISLTHSRFSLFLYCSLSLVNPKVLKTKISHTHSLILSLLWRSKKSRANSSGIVWVIQLLCDGLTQTNSSHTHVTSFCELNDEPELCHLAGNFGNSIPWEHS